MPQMAPMRWVTLFSMFITFLIMITIKNCYIHAPMTTSQVSHKHQINKMSLKW